MPRMPRFFVPELPLHIIQRGNDRQLIFGGRDDVRFYRFCLARAARDHGVAIHAYVFMSNHVHLLATPSVATSVPKLMQSIGRIYVKYFNSAYCRTGTLWEGRYKAAIVDDERYLLTCMRYIELNPVRAHCVDPAQISMVKFFLERPRRCRRSCPAAHRQLGSSAETRQASYRQLFRSTIPVDDISRIRDATQHAWALGSAEFRSRDRSVEPPRRTAADGPSAQGRARVWQKSSLTLLRILRTSLLPPLSPTSLLPGAQVRYD